MSIINNLPDRTDHDKIQTFRAVFRGRRDAYGTGTGLCVKERVTDQLILGHLTGKQRVGLYMLSPEILDGSGTYWAVADVDTDDLNLAIDITASLHELGVSGHIEKSKSKGFHVWVFFTEPATAQKARAMMEYALEDNEVEIFPKQTSIKDGSGGYGYGNYINLPLFGANVPQGRTVFLNPENAYKPYTDQWGFLDSIQRVSPEALSGLVETGELDLEPEILVSSDEGKHVSSDGYADMLPCIAPMMEGVSQGRRDEVAFCLAKHWRVEKHLPEVATLAILHEWNKRNDPPLESQPLEAKVRSAYSGRGGKGYTALGCNNELIKAFCDKASCPIFQKRPKELDSPYFRKDTFIPPRLGNALMEEYSFLYSTGQLYIYKDGVYQPIGEDFIKDKCRHKLGEEARVNRINEVIAHVTDLSRTKTEEFNTHKNLINVENGMFNWRTGEMLPHSERYLSTIQMPVKYEPAAKCPTVDCFFATTLPPDCIHIAEEMFGYALIPDTRFHKSFMLTGSGANGKSTYLTLLEKFIGTDNVCKVPIQELCDHRFKRADLYGKLINLFADLDDRALRSTSYFKTVASGDAIDAERKNRDPFYFRPFARLVYSANEIPKSRDRSYAYYRRWCIIPFPNQFKGTADDKNMAEKLTQPEELSGLLNRALTGLKRLFENNDFTESKTVNEALLAYQKANDTVMAFISDKCELDGAIERKELYNAYIQYCENEGYKPESRQSCYNRVRGHGIGERKLPRERLFVGIRLRAQFLDSR